MHDDVGVDVARQRRRRLDASGLLQPVAVGVVVHLSPRRSARTRRRAPPRSSPTISSSSSRGRRSAAGRGAGRRRRGRPGGRSGPPRAAGRRGSRAAASRAPRREKRASVVVAHELQRPEEPGAADVADDRHARLEPLEQLARCSGSSSRTFSSTPSRSKISMLRSAIAAATGWPANVMPCISIRPSSYSGSAILSDTITAPIGAYADVMPLAQRDQVGRDAEARGREPLADAPEAGDDLVGDQRDPVLVAQRAQAGPVAVGRDEAAAGVLHRLGDQHRDGLRPGLDDRALDLVQQPRAERGLVGGVGIAERVRVGDPHDRDRRRAERLLHRAHAGERERARASRRGRRSRARSPSCAAARPWPGSAGGRSSRPPRPTPSRRW